MVGHARGLAIVIAVTLLVAIGAVEGLISARQLAELPGRARPTLGAGGAALTVAGFALSVAVYALLGVFLGRLGASEKRAVTTGVTVGFFAGLVGGALRAALLYDYLSDTITRFGLPLEFATVALSVFVLVAVLTSAAAGGAITWLGCRTGRRRVAE